MKPGCGWIDRAGRFRPMKEHEFKPNGPPAPVPDIALTASTAKVGGSPRANEAGRQDPFARLEPAPPELPGLGESEGGSPGNGLPPDHMAKVLGRLAKRDLKRGEPLAWDMLA